MDHFKRSHFLQLPQCMLCLAPSLQHGHAAQQTYSKLQNLWDPGEFAGMPIFVTSINRPNLLSLANFPLKALLIFLSPSAKLVVRDPMLMILDLEGTKIKPRDESIICSFAQISCSFHCFILESSQQDPKETKRCEKNVKKDVIVGQNAPCSNFRHPWKCPPSLQLMFAPHSTLITRHSQ